MIKSVVCERNLFAVKVTWKLKMLKEMGAICHFSFTSMSINELGCNVPVLGTIWYSIGDCGS